MSSKRLEEITGVSYLGSQLICSPGATIITTTENEYFVNAILPVSQRNKIKVIRVGEVEITYKEGRDKVKKTYKRIIEMKVYDKETLVNILKEILNLWC